MADQPTGQPAEHATSRYLVKSSAGCRLMRGQLELGVFQTIDGSSMKYVHDILVCILYDISYPFIYRKT